MLILQFFEAVNEVSELKKKKKTSCRDTHKDIYFVVGCYFTVFFLIA